MQEETSNLAVPSTESEEAAALERAIAMSLAPQPGKSAGMKLGIIYFERLYPQTPAGHWSGFNSIMT